MASAHCFLLPLTLLACLGCSASGGDESSPLGATPRSASGSPREGSGSRSRGVPELSTAGENKEAAPTGKAGVYDDWSRFLAEHVSEQGWVDYAAIRSADFAALDAFLGRLAETDAGSLRTTEERLAFWINAYNAVCIRKIIEHGLPKEVPHAKLFGKNIFEERTYVVAGKKRSLDGIEHGILREEFSEPRVHATIVCAASSCPRLRREAYEPARLDQQLDEECRSWISAEVDLKGQRKNRLDAAAKTFYASKIFSWFQDDFGGSDEAVLRFVKRYVSESDREFLQKNSVRVRYLAYDWTLNRQR